MKNFKTALIIASFIAVMFPNLCFGQNLQLIQGIYDQDPYPGYKTDGSATGTYTITLRKDAYTFTPGQFTINVAFPVGAVYAGGGTIPAGFTVTAGGDGDNFAVITITGTYSGTGPGATRNFVLPIKLVASAEDQPTGTTIQWLDPFVTEDPQLNSTGSDLNVLDINLPVKLAGFDAVREGSVAQLSWTTTEEINSDVFEVEHSLDAKVWNTIGKVKATGDSKLVNKYGYTHTAPASTLNYYRLKMIDFDGTFAFSRLESVNFERGQMTLYPNPAGSYVFAPGAQSVRVLSITGVPLANPKVENGRVEIGALPAGMYLLEIRRVEGLTAERLMIAR